MPAERLSMRQIRDVLRLHCAARLSQRATAASLGLSQGAVSGYLSRARAAGVSWPLPEDVDDARLEALLFPPPSGIAADQRPMPDWGWVHRELRRPDVTLALLWEEYRAGAADGFSYSWFCDLYRAWAGRLKPTMRQIHLAGDKLFVDFAGRTAEVIDAGTGEIIPVQIFVAVLGASSFTYAEAVWSQKLPDWIGRPVGHRFRRSRTLGYARDRGTWGTARCRFLSMRPVRLHERPCSRAWILGCRCRPHPHRDFRLNSAKHTGQSRRHLARHRTSRPGLPAWAPWCPLRGAA
jgi:transposase